MLALLRFVILGLIRRWYKVEIHGQEHLPKGGGALLVANHCTWIDSFLISLLAERQVRFVIYRGFLNIRAISWFIRLTGAIPISNDRPRDAVRSTANAANEGDLVCFFPEGQLSRSGIVTELRNGIRLIARHTKVPILPVYIDGIWGSIFSFERGRFFRKWPRRLPHSVRVTVGKPITTGPEVPVIDATAVRERLQLLSVTGLSTRPGLRQPLAFTLIDSLKRHTTRPLFLEYSGPAEGNSSAKRRRKISRASALAAAIALAARWRVSLPDDEPRVGILLPGGAAAALLNFGLVLAGKVPVSLPFPFGDDPAPLAKMLEQLGIRTVLTSRAFAPAVNDFPWQGKQEGRFLDMRAEIDAAGAVRMLIERVRACIEPKPQSRRRLGRALGIVAAENANAEASGYVWHDPDSKGGQGGELRSTFLTQFDLQAATAQLLESEMLDRAGERIFCEQSHNSAIGQLFAMWLPALTDNIAIGRSTGARRREVDGGGSIESVIAAETATVMISSKELRTQIFESGDWHPAIAGHLRRIYEFDSRGPGADDALERITGAPVCPGWAPEEIGRVVSLSVPDSPAPGSRQFDQPGRRSCSVGRLLPGAAAIFGEAEAEDSAQNMRQLSLLIPSPRIPPETTPVLETEIAGKCIHTALQARFDAAGFLFLDQKGQIDGPDGPGA